MKVKIILTLFRCNLIFNIQDFLKHGQTCENSAKGCQICKRIQNLLTLHARSCKLAVGVCNIPRCKEIRDHMRQMASKQQQMDDRRRKQMNEMYLGVPISEEN